MSNSFDYRDCPCKTCKQRPPLGLKPVRFYRNEDVSLLAFEMAAEIFKDFHRLKRAVGAFEDVLTDRWTAKTAEDRRSFFKSVRPDVPARHRAEFEHIREPQKFKNNKMHPNKAFFDIPQINLEDLCQESALLAFIKSRSDHYPYKFVFSDLEMSNAKSETLHWPGVSFEKLMMFHGQNTPDTYGALKTIKELGDEKVQLGLTSPLGVVVMQTPKRKMSFLVVCCKHLLPEYDLDDVP